MSNDVQVDPIQRRIDVSRALAAPALEGYEIVALIGEGSFGDVWEARDKARTTVAIKRFRQGLSKRSCDEVEMLRALDDARGIVKIKDINLHSEPYCYVMEYMRGGTLRNLMASEGGKLPFAWAWSIFEELVEALVYVHAKGAVHCDIKPENVLMDAVGNPRLSDFGQARSRHGRSLGTLFYMPPEQALREDPDPQGDVYALGAMLYEMLTGKRPRYDEKLAEKLSVRSQTSRQMRQKLNEYARYLEDAPPPEDHRQAPGVDAAARKVIEKCLAIDLSVRPKDAKAVLALIQEREWSKSRQPLLILCGRVLPALLCAGVLVVFVFGMILLNKFRDQWVDQVVANNQAIAQAIALATRARFDERIVVMERESKKPDWLRLLETIREENAVERPLDETRKLHGAKSVMGAGSQAPEAIKRLLEKTEDVYTSIDHVFDRWAIGDARGASLGNYGRFKQKENGKDKEDATWDLANFGGDYSWRGWFNGETDEQEPKEIVPPDDKSAKKAQSRLSQRLDEQDAVSLTHPYFRNSKQVDKRFWTLTISSVIRSADDRPLGVLCGQINLKEFNENISGVERAVQGSAATERVVVVVNELGQTLYHPELAKKVQRDNAAHSESPLSADQELTVSDKEQRVPTLNEKRNEEGTRFFKEPFEWTQESESGADPIDANQQKGTYKDPWNDKDEIKYFVGRAVTKLHNGQKLAVFVMEREDNALLHFTTARTFAIGLFIGLIPLVVGIFVGNWFLYRNLSRREKSDDA